MSWLILEIRTGAIDGCFQEKQYAIDAKKRREKQYKGSAWILCDVSAEKIFKMFSAYDFQIFYDSRLEWTLQSLYGDSTLIKVKKDDESIVNFNFNNTAFDVLTDYAFGGDKQAALDYLKTL